MHSVRVVAGTVMLALFGGLLSLLGNVVAPPPPSAPDVAWYVGPVTGVITLVCLGLWWWRGSRAALWVAVVVTAVANLLPLLDVANLPFALLVTVLAALAVTVVAIVLLAPALYRSAATGPAR
ncbi:hypothetical protein [Pseudonocardia alni]|uniref:hypothetical protein n=1 Tax=Pseudonocardia alni TaxID=33907 RepID=UPI00280C32DF|nr:hypothetical protein [Pseudonocardia alni]